MALLNPRNVLQPVTLCAGNFSFLKPFFSTRNLLFPVILGIGWWEKYAVNTLYSSITIRISHKSGQVIRPVKRSWSRKTASLAQLDIKLTVALPDCIRDLSEVFDEKASKLLPRHTRFDFKFKTTVELVKIQSPIYTLTLKEKEALDVWLRDMLEKKFITPKFSCIASPLLFVEKSDGSL